MEKYINHKGHLKKFIVLDIILIFLDCFFIQVQNI